MTGRNRDQANHVQNGTVIAVPKNVSQDRYAGDVWLDGHSRRRVAKWRQDALKPAIWKVDRVRRSPTAFLTEITNLATELPPRGQAW